MSAPCLAILASLLLAMPLAAAVDATAARCNSFYCFSVLDTDSDGEPDGIIGGTTSFVHGAPTVQAGWTPTGTFAFGDALAGDEEEGGFIIDFYVGADRDEGNVSAAYVGAGVSRFDAETGKITPIAGAAVLADDSDEDGRADRVLLMHVLP